MRASVRARAYVSVFVLKVTDGRGGNKLIQKPYSWGFCLFLSPILSLSIASDFLLQIARGDEEEDNEPTSNESVTLQLPGKTKLPKV